MYSVYETYIKWESVLIELENEFQKIDSAFQKGKSLSNIVERKAISGMTFEEIVYFYDTTIKSLRLYESVDLFACFEKMIFNDAEERKKDSKRILYNKLCKLNLTNTKVSKLIDIWRTHLKSKLSKKIFVCIDNARQHRNWVAHGCRFQCQTQTPPQPVELYHAIKVVFQEISATQ